MTDPAEPPVEVTLQSEVVHTTTERRAVERVRLRRIVVTERRTIEVEVSHEEFRLEREPVPSAEDPLDVPAAARTVSMTLHEERIEIVRTVVPAELVTVHVDQVQGTADRDLLVAHEEVSFDLDGSGAQPDLRT